MKKIRMKLISVVLIISMMSGILLIHSSANEVEYDNIAHHYFDKLRTNVPANTHGSCGYVAMSMLLSFYDIYWNNTFVDDKYMNLTIKPSAGLYNDYPGGVPTLLLEKNDEVFPNIDSTQDDDNTIESEPTKTDEELENEYRAFIADKSGDYFHMYLLSLGIQSGLHPTDDDELGFEITVNEMAVLLDGYLDSRFGQADYYRTDQNYGSNAKITIHTVSENKDGKTRNDVINAIKTQVSAGNPVIYRADAVSSDTTSRSSDTGNNKDKAGHFMVAYHQTDSDIWFHNGKSNDDAQTELFSTTDYNLDIEAIWIEINENLLPHSCSYRYNYHKTNGNEAVCSCNAYKNHPAHIHRVCEYESASNTPNTHVYNCYCSSFEEEHSYNKYKYLNTNKHRIDCACGATGSEEAHNYYRYSSFGASGHRIYCNCGDYIFESHPYKIKRCNICGYFDDTYYQPWQNPDDPQEELLE